MPVSGVSASGGARKTWPDSAHPRAPELISRAPRGPPFKLNYAEDARCGPAQALPAPRAGEQLGGQRGVGGGAGSLPSGTAPPTSRGGGRKRASALREEEGVPSNCGAMPTQREALERPLSSIPFHSFRQPPTHPLKTPILLVVRPRSRAGTKLLSAPSPDQIESLGMRGGGEDLTRTY